MFVITRDNSRPEGIGRYRVEIRDVAHQMSCVFHCDREYLQTMADEMIRWLEVPEGGAPGPSHLERALRVLREAAADGCLGLST